MHVLHLVQGHQRSKYIGRPQWPCKSGRFWDGKACKNFSRVVLSNIYSHLIALNTS